LHGHGFVSQSFCNGRESVQRVTRFLCTQIKQNFDPPTPPTQIAMPLRLFERNRPFAFSRGNSHRYYGKMGAKWDLCGKKVPGFWHKKGRKCLSILMGAGAPHGR